MTLERVNNYVNTVPSSGGLVHITYNKRVCMYVCGEVVDLRAPHLLNCFLTKSRNRCEYICMCGWYYFLAREQRYSLCSANVHFI